jgi:hypothetical protein
MYQPYHEKATNTYLIANKQCAEIVKIVIKPAGSKFDNHERGHRRKYKFQGNVAECCLY